MSLLEIATGSSSLSDRARGRAARAAGKSFEAELDESNKAYSRAGLATMARAHPPVGGPPRRMYFTGKGQVDFVGNVLGIPIAFDAKSERHAASYRYGAKDMHELDFLLDWRAKGGVSFILLIDRSRDVLYLIDQLDTLRLGKSVPMRTHEKPGAPSSPLVPALIRTEQERVVASARGFPVWPWIDLAVQASERIALVVRENSTYRKTMS